MRGESDVTPPWSGFGSFVARMVLPRPHGADAGATAGSGGADSWAKVIPLRPIVAGRHHGPALIIDAVETFLTHDRNQSTRRQHRFNDHTIRSVAGIVGQYRALLDVEDEEIATALSVLSDLASPSLRERQRAAVGHWLTWCLGIQLPAPSLPELDPRSGPAWHERGCRNDQ
jgi:hypothetical protein